MYQILPPHPPCPPFHPKGHTGKPQQHRQDNQQVWRPDIFSENTEGICPENIRRASHQGKQIQGLLCPEGKIFGDSQRQIHHRKPQKQRCKIAFRTGGQKHHKPGISHDPKKHKDIPEDFRLQHIHGRNCDQFDHLDGHIPPFSSKEKELGAHISHKDKGEYLRRKGQTAADFGPVFSLGNSFLFFVFGISGTIFVITLSKIIIFLNKPKKRLFMFLIY